MPVWAWLLVTMAGVILLASSIEGIGRARSRAEITRIEGDAPAEAPVIEGTFDAPSRIIRIEDLDGDLEIDRAS